MLLLALACIHPKPPEVQPWWPEASAVLEHWVDASSPEWGPMPPYTAAHLKWDLRFEDQMVGRVESWHQAPNRMLTLTTLPGVGVEEEGYDGAYAWRRGPVQGDQLLEGDAAIIARFNADFYGDLNYEERYEDLAVIGTGAVDGAEVWVLRALPRGSQEPLLLYFGVEDHLLLAREETIEGPDGPVTLRTEYSEFRLQDGSVSATRVRQHGPAGATELRRTLLEYDPAALPPIQVPSDLAALSMSVPGTAP